MVDLTLTTISTDPIKLNAELNNLHSKISEMAKVQQATMELY